MVFFYIVCFIFHDFYFRGVGAENLNRVVSATFSSVNSINRLRLAVAAFDKILHIFVL